MTGSIGLGLILNVLFWTVAVLVAVGLASLAVIEWFPGRDGGAGDGRPSSRSREPAAGVRGDETGEDKVGEGEAGEGEAAAQYRKAS